MTTGERIRVLRKEHGYTQWELGQMVGCSKQIISNIERGRTEVSAEMAARFANVFHVIADELVRENDPYVMRLTPEERSLIRTYRSLDQNGRSFLREVYSSYAKYRKQGATKS